MALNIDNNQFKSFVVDIKQKILSSQYKALKAVNKELISLYWDIGKNIVEKQEEFGWGKAVVKNLSSELQNEFVGIKGFSERNLWNMRNYYIEYKDNLKLQTLSAEIGWSHNVIIFQKCKDLQQREFYIKSVIQFGWTYRLLDNNIDNNSFTKFLTNQTNFDNTIKEKYKIGKFKPEYAGKMNFYLSALNDTVKLPDENPSIGIIICKEKNRTTVEYSLKDSNQPIGVATYKTTETIPSNFEGCLPTKEEINDKILQYFEEIKLNNQDN